MIYGIKKSPIGSINVNAEPCRNCSYQGAQNVIVYGRYAHVFWIPVFPLGRKMLASCPSCQHTLNRSQFSQAMGAQVYQQRKSVKRPIWHYAGMFLALALITIAVIIAFTASPDPRKALLDVDEDKMVLKPKFESDSISFKMKESFDESPFWAEQSSEFAYFSATREDRILVLMKIPKLKKMDKEDRPIALDVVNMVLDLQGGVADMDRYLGIKGKYTYMLIESPGNLENSRLASSRYLLPFYGEKK